LSFKNKLKEKLVNFPFIWKSYQFVKVELLRVLGLRYFFYDISRVYINMHWNSKQKKYAILSSSLLFQYHKLEKGLVMPGPKRLFGIDPANAVIKLLREWNQNQFASLVDPIYLGAIGTLQSYRDRLEEFALDPEDIISSKLNDFLSSYKCQKEHFSTPCALIGANKLEVELSLSNSFAFLMNARKSVRNYLDKAVPESTMIECVKLAQLSPSACNRQPCKVEIVSNKALKDKLLSHQNGNAGFGYLAPHIAVITADSNCFFGATERNEPYIDGGLFSMSFLLALKSKGISSCCLNWCVKPKTDRAVHKLLNLDDSINIVMLVAFGYAPDGTDVPRSPRRDVSEIIKLHQ